MRHAYVDRNSYLGDPDFVKNPLDALLDKDYAGQDPRRDRSEQGRRLRRTSSPASRRTKAATPRTTRSSTRTATRSRSPTRSTTGSAPAWSPRAPACCSTTRWTTSPPSSACPTSTAWCRARPTPSRRASGRCRSMSPTIVTKDGKPVMVVGTPGRQPHHHHHARRLST